MFEALDDPDGDFRPSPAFRAGVRARARRLRRRRAGGLALATGTSLAVVAGGVVALQVRDLDSSVDRVEVAIPPAAAVDAPTNVLLVGVDAAGRADALVVVRVAGGGSPVAALTLPRDLVGDGDDRRLAEVGADGPDALVAMLDDRFGVAVDHYVELDADGLAALVDAVGGVRLEVGGRLTDRMTGLDVPAAACSVLDGDTVAALVRSRGLQIDGRIDGTADLGRNDRQRTVLASALASLRDIGPSDLPALADVLTDHARVDAGLGLGRMVDLGREVLDAPELLAEALPVVPHELADGALVLLPAAGADDVLARYRSGGGPAPAPTPPLDDPASVIAPC